MIQVKSDKNESKMLWGEEKCCGPWGHKRMRASLAPFVTLQGTWWTKGRTLCVKAASAADIIVAGRSD